MPLARIMVMLWEMPNADAALHTAERAYGAASSPSGLCFAISRRFERAIGLALAARPFPGELVFYGERSGLAALGPLLREESHFLALMGAHGFSDKWDMMLLNRLAKTSEKNAVLTGCIGEADGPLPPQPYLPALADNFEKDGVLLQRGLPLVCSAAPVRTLVINPALLFGRVDFLRQVDLRRATLSIAAYVAGVPVYALDRPALWPLRHPPELRLVRPVEEALPGTTLARFEQLAGFRYEKKRAGVRTNWGLFTPENTYPQQLPNKLAVAQRAKNLLAFARKQPMPLLATAFIDLPAPKKPIPVYLIRFDFLKALNSLPLTLYTGGNQERALRAAFLNAYSYPDNSLLSKEYLKQGMSKEQWLERNKLLLMEKTALRHPDFTHVAWVNMDILKHPICPQALPDFSSMMDERVHFATVNAIPDLSFLIAPVRHLRVLRQAIQDITHLDSELKRGFSEITLYQRLYQKYPGMFALHPMPKKHLLFLTAFDPQLLDARYQSLLAQKKPVVLGVAAPEKENGK